MSDSLPAKPFPDVSEYLLEAPLHCHHCHKEITCVHVVRLLRVKVSFVSTLPRRGHVIICPECRGILSGDLGGMA
ncbi:MAG TPA: hypothetical protein VJ486_08750 [Geothrix sp.]|nr:hypothetical protein [Geothrix sp.]